jgi:hypothetical protein
MKWEFFYKNMLKTFPPRARIIMYLTTKIDDPNFDGIIITTLKSITAETHTSYATTQKVLKDLQSQGFIIRIQNGVYAPSIPVTGLSKKQIFKIAKQNGISSESTVIQIGKEQYLCPTNASQYLTKR